MRLLLLLCGFLLATLAAEAGMKAGPNMAGPGHHRLKGVGAPSGPPLDGLTSPIAAYGFRKLKTAYAGNALRIRRASDNLELDIGFVGGVPGSGAPWNEAAAVTHCAATTCFVRTWYDQSGNARDLVQTTVANQPQVIFGCQNFIACARVTTGVQRVATVAAMTPSAVLSIDGVAKRASGTGVCWLITNGNFNRIYIDAAPNIWVMAGSATIGLNATDNAWHAAAGAINGAASALNIDGVETTGNATGSIVSATIQAAIGAASTSCDFAELLLWDAYALTAGERTVLVSNQRSFWGF